MSQYEVPHYKESLQLLWWIIHTHHDGRIEIPANAFYADRTQILSSKVIPERNTLEVKAQ